MRKQRTHYDKEFKENAVNLRLDRKNVSDPAHEQGITRPIVSLAQRIPTKRRKPFPWEWSPFPRWRG